MDSTEIPFQGMSVDSMVVSRQDKGNSGSYTCITARSHHSFVSIEVPRTAEFVLV